MYPIHSITDMRRELESWSRVPVKEQQLMLEDVLLAELGKSLDQVQALPRTSQEEPMILLPGRTRPKMPREVDPILAEIEGNIKS